MVQTKTNGPRLLLLEFLNDDAHHQHRAETYPFLQGYARARGATTEWVTLTAGREARPTHPYLVELPPDSERLLVDAVEAFGPTHVFLNEKTARGTGEAVDRAAPDARRAEPPDPLVGRLERAAVHGWLFGDDGVGKDLPDSILDAAIPDYACRRLDPDVPTVDHFLEILVPPYCMYGRSVKRNPFFRELDLDGIEHANGCSFCGRGGSSRPPRPEEAASHALLQLRRYHETVPPESRRKHIKLWAAPAVRRMDVLFEGLHELTLPPSDLYFSCRVDELLSMGAALREWLPSIAADGHCLHFWQIGLENFSPDENQRLNKGVTPAQIDEAVALLTELETAWPTAFRFRQHGGFAMIGFTPWTRIDDLRINLREMARLDLLPGQAGLLQNRLQLRPGTPLERLAARDGLLVEQPDETDPFATICITHWGEEEIPWRFQHEEVGTVYSLVVRLFPFQRAPFDDPLWKHIQDLAGAGRGLARPGAEAAAAEIWAIEILLDLAEKDPGAPATVLLERLMERSGAVAETPMESGPASPPPGSRALTAEQRRRMGYLLGAVGKRFGDRLHPVVVEGLVDDGADDELIIGLAIEGSRGEIVLSNRRSGKRSAYESEHYLVTYRANMRDAWKRHQKRVCAVVTLFERAIAEHAPELLPGKEGRGG